MVWDNLVIASSDMKPYCLAEGATIWQETTTCMLKTEDRRKSEDVSVNWTGTNI